MENSVSGIRDIFRDLLEEYMDKEDASFLYRYLWAEDAEEMLKKAAKALGRKKDALPEATPENAHRIREWLCDAMKSSRESARGLLLKEAPAKEKEGQLERRNLWEELWLNDAGYQAGLITEMEYYVWLVEYLEVRPVYKKSGYGLRLKDAHVWLYPLLDEGLRDTEGALTQDILRERKEGSVSCIRNRKQVESDLEKLAGLLRSERGRGAAGPARGRQTAGEGKAAERLCGLKVRAEGREAEYLTWLTGQLREMAFYIRIQNWRENFSRKKSSDMRMFMQYMEHSYDFARKDKGGGKALNMWHWEGEFCVADRELAEKLLETVKENKIDTIFIPLAVHVYTGCVFFLAGKENYRTLYERKPDLEDSYNKAKGCCCFDYLRMDKSYRKQHPGDLVGALRMKMSFHKNVGKNYDTVLGDFKRCCLNEEEGILQSIREWNEETPPGVRIPEEFRWAYDIWHDQKGPSDESRTAFERARKDKKKMEDYYNGRE